MRHAVLSTFLSVAAIVVLLVATCGGATARAYSAPHFSHSLSGRISSDGPRSVAWHLTLRHDWSRVERDIARNDPALSSATLRALIDYAPRHEISAMQRALRSRLGKDAQSGLSALSPVARSPYSGRAVCGAGDARWKHQVRSSLLAAHDITYALQRDDCIRALRLHSRN